MFLTCRYCRWSFCKTQPLSDSSLFVKGKCEHFLKQLISHLLEFVTFLVVQFEVIIIICLTLWCLFFFSQMQIVLRALSLSWKLKPGCLWTAGKEKTDQPSRCMWVKSGDETNCWFGARRVRWSSFPGCRVTPDFYTNLCFQEFVASTDCLDQKVPTLKLTNEEMNKWAEQLSYMLYVLCNDW